MGVPRGPKSTGADRRRSGSDGLQDLRSPPKKPQDPPRGSPDPSKSAPRAPQDDPRAPQERPKTPKNAPSAPLDAPEAAQEVDFGFVLSMFDLPDPENHQLGTNVWTQCPEDTPDIRDQPFAGLPHKMCGDGATLACSIRRRTLVVRPDMWK